MAGRVTLPLLYASEGSQAQNPPTVSVYNHGTTTLATLYTDKTAAATAANPIVVASLGDLSFFAAAGDYDISVTLGEETDTFTVSVNDPTGGVIQALAPAAATLAINATLGTIVVVSPTASVTSTTVANLAVGQRLVLDFISDGTHTFAYPTTCKFAGGAAATASAVSGYRDRYEFIWDGTHLNEVSRAIGIR